MNDILHRSNRLEVRRIAAGDGRLQVVTFESYHEQPGFDRPGFGQDYFAERGITAFHVLCASNDWYQYPDMLDALAAIRAAAAGADRLLTYGSSMGAYAALRFAAPVGAHAALALSPQYSVDRSRVPFENRWGQDQRRIRFLSALDGAIAPVPLMVMAFDPRLGDDRLQAERIAAAVPAAALPLPFGGHPVGQFLNDIGLLDPLVQATLRGDVDVSAFAAAAKQARGRSPQWLVQLAERQPAARPRLAVSLAERAAALAPNSAPILHHLGLRLAAAGRFEEAVEAHQRALAAEPDEVYYLGLSTTYHAAGNVTASLDVARILQARAPHVARYHAWAASLRALSGDLEGQLADLRQALALDPLNRLYRRHMRKLRWQIGFRRYFRPSSPVR
jgi:tetratricopeptide (TPR) repeat protein